MPRPISETNLKSIMTSLANSTKLQGKTLKDISDETEISRSTVLRILEKQGYGFAKCEGVTSDTGAAMYYYDPIEYAKYLTDQESKNSTDLSTTLAVVQSNSDDLADIKERLDSILSEFGAGRVSIQGDKYKFDADSILTPEDWKKVENSVTYAHDFVANMDKAFVALFENKDKNAHGSIVMAFRMVLALQEYYRQNDMEF